MSLAPPRNDVADILDRVPISPLQVRVFVLCGLVGVLDGNDTSAIGVGASSLATALHVAPSAMGWAISGSFWGAAVGALLLGSLCDRFGRKKVLAFSVLLFGAFTCLGRVDGFDQDHSTSKGDDCTVAACGLLAA